MKKPSYTISKPDNFIGIALIVVFIACFQIVQSQPNYEWAIFDNDINGNGNVNDLVTDKNGDIYILGEFRDSLDIDPGPGQHILYSTTSTDVFLAKLDAHHNLIWVQHLSSFSSDYGRGIAMDEFDNVYITGSFRLPYGTDTIDVDPGPGVVNFIGSGSEWEAYLAKYSSDGVLQWMNSISIVPDHGHEVMMDKLNQKVNVISSTNNQNIYIAQFTYGGTKVWEHHFHGAWLTVKGAVQHKNGNFTILGDVAGEFYETVDLDPGPGTFLVWANSSYYWYFDTDFFLAQYTSSGNFVWGKHFVNAGDYKDAFGESVAVDEEDNIYLTARYNHTVDFNPGDTGGVLTGNALTRMAMARYSIDGNYNYAIKFDDDIVVYSSAVDTEGNHYIGGTQNKDIDFDPSGNQAIVPCPSGSFKFFVARYDSLANYQWALGWDTVGGNGNNVCRGLYLDSSNTLYTAGSYSGSIDFDHRAGSDVLVSPTNSRTPFVAKYPRCDTLPDAPLVIASDDTVCRHDSVTFSITSGNLYSATDWHWYSGSCGGPHHLVGIGDSITIPVSESETFFARGVGGDCVGPCSTPLTITIDNLNLDIETSTTLLCYPDSLTLTGTGYAVIYSWDSGLVNGQPFVPSIGTNQYHVTGEIDSLHCIAKDSITITVFEPTRAHASDEGICIGDTLVLYATGGQNYMWNQGIMDSIPFVPGVTGLHNYVVTGSDDSICPISDSIMVEVWSLPNVTTNTQANHKVCSGDSVTLNGGGAMTYTWTNGVIDGVPFLPHLNQTFYEVIGVDSNGCVGSDHLTMEFVTLTTIHTNIEDTVTCFGDSIVLSAFGPGLIEFDWTNGIAQNIPFAQKRGVIVYHVTGRDSIGCSIQDSVRVEAYSPHVSILPPLNTEICYPDSITLQAVGLDSYTWSRGVINGETFVPPLGRSTFIVHGHDVDDCASDTASVVILSEVCTGVGEEAFRQARIFPNPTSGLLHIDLGQNFHCTIEIINSSGKTSLLQKFSRKTILNLSHLPKGSYVYVIKENDTGNALHGQIILTD